MKDLDFTKIIHSIIQNSSESLDLSHENLTFNQVTELGKALKLNTSLKKLNLYYNWIGKDGIKILVESLSNHSSLQDIDFSYNDIGDKGAECIGELLKSNTTLKKLCFHGNSIGDEGVEYIANGLKENSTLEELNIGAGNYPKKIIGDKGAQFLSEALKTNTSLKLLNISGDHSLTDMGITDVGAISIAEALKTNDSLVRIYLYSTRISDQGAKKFASINTSVDLVLKDCKIGLEGTHALNEMNPTLRANYGKEFGGIEVPSLSRLCLFKGKDILKTKPILLNTLPDDLIEKITKPKV